MYEYESLLPKNQRILDEVVLDRAVSAGYVLVSKDCNMEDDELEHVIGTCARIIFLDDQHGGPVGWAAALICAQIAYERVLLSNPVGPLTIHISREGKIKSVIGEEELRRHFKRIVSTRKDRARRHREILPSTKPS